MLDFMIVSSRKPKKDLVEIYPKLIVGSSSDLMTRGSDFYAIWNAAENLWSTKEEVALRLIDSEVDAYRDNVVDLAKKLKSHEITYNDIPNNLKTTVDYIAGLTDIETGVKACHMWDADSGMIDKWHKYVQKQQRDNFHPLDEELIFSNTETTKESYASKRLKYPLEKCDIAEYEELISTLYSPDERHKIEWAVGSIIAGDSKKIQKFLVMYGSAGTGKSTILNIIQDLFEGYYSVFDSKALGSASNVFALEAFKSNPLVAIQHDGDLSKIEDNTRLNSLTSHEYMTVNEKFKSTYSNKFNCFLFMGTNKPVRITDSKSGIIRRLIDVTPTGNKIPSSHYKELIGKIKFQLGGIALHCLEVYRSDPDIYETYVPTAMIGATNDFYNFVLDSYDVFKRDDSTTLKAAWEMYKNYCEEAKVVYPYSQRPFKEELKSYFREFYERSQLDGEEGRVRNLYKGFITDKFLENVTEIKLEPKKEKQKSWLEFNCYDSLFDTVMADCLAQYANEDGTPLAKWSDVKTRLSDLMTDRLHYVNFPEDKWNHIVIDFDLKDSEGNKSFELNLEAASKWPATYAELSKSGQGIHLHYIYAGDVTKLSRIYDEDIEVKVYTGNSSLRRKLSKCNNLPISTISGGLPLKEEKLVNFDTVKNEKAIRTLVRRNLAKEYHPGTKPSVDFIYKILEDAYASGIEYDLTDMRPAILTFAGRSTHHADYCLKLANKMHYQSETMPENAEAFDEDTLVFFDVEVFPNLFVVVYKLAGEEHQCVQMINPTPKDIERLLKYKLVGFNNRDYDNHILYARLLGETNEQLFYRSKNIVSGRRDAKFGAAYNLSYTDIYDFSSKKQSLKKFEIELGIHHQELGLPWDQPVPEELWETVAEYCVNDVVASEATFNARKGDFLARQILAELAGMTVNDTTNQLTTRIIFGKNKHPKLIYTDLATGEQYE